MPQWSRRAYYDDLACNGNFISGINVASLGSCQQGTTPFISSCNFKSRVENGITSSEASGCAPVSGGFTDATWIPSAEDGKVVPGGNYMVINQYTSADCKPATIYEQDTFLADGQCHAIEFHQSFYKASCPSSPDGTYSLTVCDDAACSRCTSTSVLEAGTFISRSFSVNGNTCSQITGQPVKVSCSVFSSVIATRGSGTNPTSTAGNVTSATGSASNSALDGASSSSSFAGMILTSLLALFL